ncbi:transcriptional regulator [Nocardia farcinica]|uniref:sigma-54-dependent Fis family transcriptional regulator n=1 Tax=Nocardia farcinica TaxID=37329 RepID=UPI001B3C6B3E|nr:helix-turn-helix domain-containing protein [Nocardia farcinica]MBF6537825.1 transcriptional regulator [Nocardia farcinica]
MIERRRFREPIARSWRRAALAGLAPDTVLRDVRVVDVDPRSHLLAAAAPVIEELNDRLAETGMCTVLVDREGRVVHRWCGDPRAENIFDDLAIGVGTSLLEEAIGTNALGTALEMRTGIAVHGGEHFAERLRAFSCYGHPIFHPTTRRIEGVLDITVLARSASPLLSPLVAKAVADIEQQLLEGSRISERVLLAAFQTASRRSRPVVAVGDDMFVTNMAASDLLDTSDMALLRNLAGDLSGSTELELELRSGQAVLTAERVPGSRGGVLIYIQPTERRTPRPPTTGAAPVGHVCVSGQPGTGRTTAARQHAPQRPYSVLTGGQAIIGGSAAWVEQFASIVRAEQGTLCIDGVDLLPPELIEIVTRHARSGTAPHLVLTCGPLDGLPGHVRALPALCASTVELLPLANRLGELPAIAEAMLAELGADKTHHLTPGALRALGGYWWPGNLSELHAVLERAVRAHAGGAITPADFPAHLAPDGPPRDLARLERAERDAIVAALRGCGGNKVRAAQQLGISRTTLYAKMRTLRIQTY